MSSTQAANSTSTGRGAGGDRLLRLVLKLDAVVTGVNGLAYLALAGILDSIFGYPKGLQYEIGAFLAVYGVVVLFTATRPVVSRPAVQTYIVMNVLWAVLSIVALITGELHATLLGEVWGVLQALVVAGFAALQAFALSRTPRTQSA